MKSVILASVVALSTSAVHADVINNMPMLGFGGEVEYSVEGSAWAMEVGPDISLGAIGVSSRLQATATNELSMDFTGVEVEASYGLTPSLDLYSAISTSDKFKYEDIKIGVRFSF